MKVLVIGGTKFFGKRLVTSLLEEGNDVTLLTRGKAGDPFGDKVQRIKLDRRELTSFHPEIQRQFWDIVYDQVCYDAIEAGMACEVFRERTKKYVFTSSQSVYKPGGDLKESDFDAVAYRATQFASKDTDYAEAKRQAEGIFSRNMRCEYAAVRFPMVVGRDDYTLRLKFHVDHILEEKPMCFPNLKARLSLISSEDAARFLLHLSKVPLKGPVNVCSPESISLEEFIHILEAKLGKKAVIRAKSETGDLSPYGIEEDWFMNTDKVREMGFVALPIEEWLHQVL